MASSIEDHRDGGSTHHFLWRYQPLVPVAVAVVVGVASDRHVSPNLPWLICCAAIVLVSWAVAQFYCRIANRAWLSPTASSLPLLAAIMLTAAAWHHVYWNVYPSDDIANLSNRRSRPICVRGLLADEPLVIHRKSHDPLRTIPQRTETRFKLHVERVRNGDQWQAARGRVQVSVNGAIDRLHAGSRVIVLGAIIAPKRAMNPGEFDYANYLRGRRIRAIIRCDEPAGVTALPSGGAGGRLWLSQIAGMCERRLLCRMPAGHAEIAVALLLGRYELLEDAVTEKYMSTGTMHILAISGQHLAVVAGFLWLLLRFLPIPRKVGAVLLGIIVVTYALLTGTRPPVLRAAVLVCVLVGGIVLDARSRRANPLALALIIVLALNPSDLFDRGLQLSFLAVGALSWIVEPVWKWLQPAEDPLEVLIAETRPWWLRLARHAANTILFSLVMSLVVWLANAPLLAARFHVFSPIVVPLTVLLSVPATVALIAGLGLLVVDPWLPAVGSLFSKVSSAAIATMEWFVDLGAEIPGGHWYVAGPPGWWLVGTYGAMAVILVVPPRGIVRWRCAMAGVAWSSLYFATAAIHPRPDSLELQILSVGNGSAAILRLPTGRCVLIDAGQLTGPQVGSRVIAPALWENRIRHIDAVFISHADVDHYNGLRELVDRFSIGTVFVPPHFAKLDAEPVQVVVDRLRHHGVAVRVCFDGDRFDLGGGVTVRVIHPPVEFGGSDNEQSLVLMVETVGRSVLFPGDLEGVGLKRVLGTAAVDVDILISPHHGSRRANPPELIPWCKPDLVLVSQGRPRSGATLESFRQANVPILSTNTCGAITVRVRAAGCEISYVQFPATGNWPERKVRTVSSVPSLSESM